MAVEKAQSLNAELKTGKMEKQKASGSTTKKPQPRGCHVNPRVSLSEFAEKEQLRAFDVSYDDVLPAPFLCSVLNAAKVRDFYNIATTDGLDSRIERWLSEFEKALAILLRYVREDGAVYEEEFWAASRVLVALQLARTKPFRQKVLDLAILASPFVKSIVSGFNPGRTDSELDEMLSSSAAKLLGISSTIPSAENVALWAQAMWMRAMLEDFPKVSGCVIYSKVSAFVTSDNPVVWYDGTLGQADDMWDDEKNAVLEFTYPLTPHHVLLLSRQLLRGCAETTPEITDIINSRTIQRARFVYALPSMQVSVDQIDHLRRCSVSTRALSHYIVVDNAR